MNGRFARFAAIAALFLFLAPAAPSALALDRDAYRLEVLVDGIPLKNYSARGTTYVEALEGREYSIRLTNRTSGRIAVALTVDGLNTIDAKTTTARDASKWILGPHRSITLDGWQTGSSTARRFFFTTEEKSYGAWLGKTSNLGIVSAAVFREKRPVPAPITRPQTKRRSYGGRDGADAPSMRGAAGESEHREKAMPQAEPPADDELAATGIGRELQHHVRRIAFEAEASPATVLELRYEYRDALVRLGVLPREWAQYEDPLDRRERARGFEDLDFAPDPFRP
jgi:hypothetical protein